MHHFRHRAPGRVSALLFLSAGLLAAIGWCSRLVSAQEDVCNNPLSRSWWCGVWNQMHSTTRYRQGLTLQHQQRLPVNPPLCTPGFGYYNPCWRQIQVDRRCEPAEVSPVPWPSQNVPPAPVPNESVTPPVPAEPYVAPMPPDRLPDQLNPKSDEFLPPELPKSK